MKFFYSNPSVSDCSRYETPVGAMMTRNPFSINDAATICDAATFLLARNISASPVINEAGRPIGVLSLADIVCYEQRNRSLQATRSSVRVKEIMNRELFFVSPSTPVGEVIDDLLNSGLERLFVIDDDTVLIGVVSTRDLLRHVRLEKTASVRSSLRRDPHRRRASTQPRHPATFLRMPRAGARIVPGSLYG